MANTFTLSHLTGLLVPMFHFNAISRPYCLSYLINCPFSFIFLHVDPETDWTLIVQWLTALDQKLVQTIYYLTSPVLGTPNTSEPPLPSSS